MKWGQAQDYPKVGKDRMTKCSFQLRGHEEFINVLETKKEKQKRTARCNQRKGSWQQIRNGSSLNQLWVPNFNLYWNNDHSIYDSNTWMVDCFRGANMHDPQVKRVGKKWLQKSYKCMFITKDHINMEMKLWKLKKMEARDSRRGGSWSSTRHRGRELALNC